jgi:hypothetical protein
MSENILIIADLVAEIARNIPEGAASWEETQSLHRDPQAWLKRKRIKVPKNLKIKELRFFYPVAVRSHAKPRQGGGCGAMVYIGWYRFDGITYHCWQDGCGRMIIVGVPDPR